MCSPKKEPNNNEISSYCRSESKVKWLEWWGVITALRNKFKVATVFDYYIHPAGHGYYFGFHSDSPFIAAYLQVQ